MFGCSAILGALTMKKAMVAERLRFSSDDLGMEF